jgi:drug/metabolite transporter (DMT)-like permease
VTSRRRAAGVGLLSLFAYVLILYALKHAPVSAVAPARESSILIGTLLGAVVLGEGDTRRRVIAAAATLVGITALALG